MQRQTNEDTSRGKKARFYERYNPMKSIAILACLFALILCCESIAESVKSEELARLLKEKTEQILMEHNDKKTADVNNKIDVISTRIAKLTEKLPTTEIDAELATWIEQSLLDLVEHGSGVDALLSEKENSEDPLQPLVIQAERVFPRLDRTTAQALIARRKELVQLSDGYWMHLQRLLMTKMSELKTIDLRLSPFPSKDTLIKEIADLKQEETKKSHHGVASAYNRELESIYDKLLTMALKRKITSEIKHSDFASSRFTNNNIFSLTFDPENREGKLKPKKFQEVRKSLEETIEKVLKENDGVASFSIREMSWFIYIAGQIQWGQEFAFPEMLERGRRVQWRNQPQLWEPTSREPGK